MTAGTVAGAVAGTARADLTSEAGRYLTFSLSGETYALPIADVIEIMEYRTLTVVPMMPAHIRGVINLRGKVVPVVDLATRFGNGATTIARRTGIIILETASSSSARHEDEQGGRRTLGIVVDAVSTVIELTLDDMEAPPSFGAGVRTDFISGMAKDDGSFIVVLDVKRLLSADGVHGEDGVAAAEA